VTLVKLCFAEMLWKNGMHSFMYVIG